MGIVDQLITKVIEMGLALLPLLIQLGGLLLMACAFAPVRAHIRGWFTRYVGWTGVWFFLIALIILAEVVKK